MFNPLRKMSPWYAAAELLWYLSGTDDVELVKAYAPQYVRFTEDGRRAWGAYGARWLNDVSFKTELLRVVNDNKVPVDLDRFVDMASSPLSQLQIAAWTLKDKPESRQCVVTSWNAGDLPHALAGDKNDLPCTVSMIFRLQAGKLYLMTTMRSNDVWLGLPYDIWCFTAIQQIIADALDVELGWYQHSAMSMHLYKRNEEKAMDAAEPPSFSAGPLEYRQRAGGHREYLQDAIRLAPQVHKLECFPHEIDDIGQGTFLHQCLAMMAAKYGKTDIRNKLMERHVKLCLS
jgi:thymidylate synthase